MFSILPLNHSPLIVLNRTNEPLKKVLNGCPFFLITIKSPVCENTVTLIKSSNEKITFLMLVEDTTARSLLIKQIVKVNLRSMFSGCNCFFRREFLVAGIHSLCFILASHSCTFFLNAAFMRSPATNFKNGWWINSAWEKLKWKDAV